MKYTIALLALAIIGGDYFILRQMKTYDAWNQRQDLVNLITGYGDANGRLTDRRNMAIGSYALGSATTQRDSIAIGEYVDFSASGVMCLGKNYCRKLGEFVKYDDIRADKKQPHVSNKGLETCGELSACFNHITKQITCQKSCMPKENDMKKPDFIQQITIHWI